MIKKAAIAAVAGDLAAREHVANRLIATMNETLKQGYDADLVASAGLAAAAAFTGFNLSENGRRQASNVELGLVFKRMVCCGA